MNKLIVLLIFSFELLAYQDLSCEDYQRVQCQRPGVYHQYILKNEWLNNKLELRQKLIDQEKEELESYIRYIRNDNEYLKQKWIKDDIDAIKLNFKTLKGVNALIEELNKKLTAIKSANSWRVDLEKDIEVLKKLKLDIFNSYPVLTTEYFSDLAKKNEIGNLEFETVLEKSAVELWTNLDKNKVFENKVKNAIVSNDLKNFELNTFLKGLDLKQEIQDFAFPRYLCDFFQATLNERKDHENAKLIADGAIALGSLFVPIGIKAGTFTARAIGLANWGLKSRIFNTSNILAASASSYFFVNGVKNLNDINTKCEAIKTDVIINREAQKYSVYKSCKEQLLDQFKLMAFSGGLTAATSAKAFRDFTSIFENSKYTYRLLSTKSHDDFFEHLRHLPFLRDDFSDTGVRFARGSTETYVLNLNNTLEKSHLDEMANEYWEYVAKIYKKRLNLTDEEVDKFIESSVNMSNRTLLVVNKNLDKAPGKEPFTGGVALVTAEGTTERLPMEKALNMDFPRKGKVAEIVRLTASGDKNEFSELMSVLTQVSRADSEIKEFYVYTSKLHYRLYKRVFKSHDVVHKNDRDFVIRLNRAQMIEATRKLY